MLYREPHPDEVAPNARTMPQVFFEEGKRRGQTGPHSTKVGWTLRNRKGKIEDAFAFRINPQGLTRTDGSRAQLHATKGGLFVDSFGPGATVIQLRQLIGSGKIMGGGQLFTAREDVQRFMKTIYLPATKSRSGMKVFFHDNHFERGIEELVFFPPQSHVLSRAVDQHNVWKLDLQMIGLEKYPYSEVRAEAIDRTGQRQLSVPYRVRDGDTLLKIAARVAGPVTRGAEIVEVQSLILEFNPAIRRRRPWKNGHLKPLQLGAGELIRVPA
ncbi:MAG TPA: hypothetical protein VN238_02345 [Solirubrobacteraceae bacterium]|nr:hypothetical protein [Solirubrobacteraceae bacterium]